MSEAQLPPGFSMRVAEISEHPTLIKLLALATKNDPLLQYATEKCPPDLLEKWHLDLRVGRWSAPDCEFFAIIEDATG